jgi:hypothetical protein
LKTCTAASDCTFCRADSVQALCDTGATSVDGVGAAVCLPERL